MARRVSVLGSHIPDPPPRTATVAAPPALTQQKHFHYIGELSPLSRSLIPPKRSQGGNSNQRAIEWGTDELRRVLTDDGTPAELYGNTSAVRGLAARFAAEGDAPLFPGGGGRGAATDAAPLPRVAAAVRMVEETPFRLVPRRAAEALRGGGVARRDAVAAAVVAVNRSTELVADHHGGPIHPTSGGWAVLWVAGMLASHAGPRWADLAAAQAVALASRHIDLQRKLNGPTLMPDLAPAAGGEAPDVAAAVGGLRRAIAAQHPVRAERLLLRALRLGAGGDDILAAVAEEGVPRHVVDDHFMLYPVYACMTLDSIGWEHAPWLLRPVVRYVSTVPPIARGRSGAQFLDRQGPGGKSEFERIHALAQRAGLLRAGAVADAPPAAAAAAELRRAEALALAIAEDVPAPGSSGVMTDDEIFARVPDLLAGAMAGGDGGRGLSLHGAMTALSLAAARLYLRNNIGNPMDVHFLTGVGARRYLMRNSKIPAATKVFSILLWCAGFEVTQRYLFYRTKGRGNFTHNPLFGATRVPAHAAALAASPAPPPRDPAQLLDYISHAITVRPGEVRDPRGRATSHDQQIRDLQAGRVANTGVVCGDDVATRVLPAVWLYEQRGGDLDAFFTRMCEHTAMDDYSEMHLWKHTAVCYRECAATPPAHRWLYMCAAAKAVCHGSGLGRLGGVYAHAAEVLPEAAHPPFGAGGAAR